MYLTVTYVAWRCLIGFSEQKTSGLSAQSDKATSTCSDSASCCGRKITLSNCIMLLHRSSAGDTPVTSFFLPLWWYVELVVVNHLTIAILFGDRITSRKGIHDCVFCWHFWLNCSLVWILPRSVYDLFRGVITLSLVNWKPRSDTIWLGHPKIPTRRIYIRPVPLAVASVTA